jgi:hypothetical protein
VMREYPLPARNVLIDRAECNPTWPQKRVEEQSERNRRDAEAREGRAPWACDPRHERAALTGKDRGRTRRGQLCRRDRNSEGERRRGH